MGISAEDSGTGREEGGISCMPEAAVVLFGDMDIYGVYCPLLLLALLFSEHGGGGGREQGLPWGELEQAME